MSRQGEFMVYCAEHYKAAKNMTGKQVSELFSCYRVWEYIYSCAFAVWVRPFATLLPLTSRWFIPLCS